MKLPREQTFNLSNVSSHSLESWLLSFPASDLVGSVNPGKEIYALVEPKIVKIGIKWESPHGVSRTETCSLGCKHTATAQRKLGLAQGALSDRQVKRNWADPQDLTQLPHSSAGGTEHQGAVHGLGKSGFGWAGVTFWDQGHLYPQPPVKALPTAANQFLGLQCRSPGTRGTEVQVSSGTTLWSGTSRARHDSDILSTNIY